MDGADKYKDLVRHFPGGAVYVFDRDLRYTAAGGESLLAVGLDPAAIEGKTLHEVWGPEQSRVSEPICRAALAGKSTTVEEPFQDKVYLISTFPYRNQKREIIGGVVVAQDITERRETETLGIEKRRDLELKDRALDACDSGIIIVDAIAADHPIVYANSGFLTMTGYSLEEVLGRNCRFLQGTDRDQPSLETLRQAVRREESVSVVLRNYRKDGSLFWNELSISPVQSHNRITHFIGVQQDISERVFAEEERRKLAESLARGRKLEALGQLAGGMAHEFNNLLAGLQNYTDLALLEEDLPPRVADYLGHIARVGMRGGAIAKQLLTFARGGRSESNPLHLTKLVRGLSEHLHLTFPPENCRLYAKT